MSSYGDGKNAYDNTWGALGGKLKGLGGKLKGTFESVTSTVGEYAAGAEWAIDGVAHTVSEKTQEAAAHAGAAVGEKIEDISDAAAKAQYERGTATRSAISGFLDKVSDSVDQAQRNADTTETTRQNEEAKRREKLKILEEYDLLSYEEKGARESQMGDD